MVTSDGDFPGLIVDGSFDKPLYLTFSPDVGPCRLMVSIVGLVLVALTAGCGQSSSSGAGNSAASPSSPAGGSIQSPARSNETPTGQPPAEGARKFVRGVPQIRISDITPTLASETSSETAIQNILASYTAVARMALAETFDTNDRLLDLFLSPNSIERAHLLGAHPDHMDWIEQHPNDANLYAWTLDEVTSSTIDKRTDNEWVITAKINIADPKTIEHFEFRCHLQKIQSPHLGESIWALDALRSMGGSRVETRS